MACPALPGTVPHDPADRQVCGRRKGVEWVECALFISVALAAGGHLIIKGGLNAIPSMAQASLGARLTMYVFDPMVILGLLIYATGTLLWIVAVAKRDISYLYPITAINYVLVTLAGRWLFGESVSTGRWIGVLVVMLGVIVLQTSRTDRTA